VTDWTIVVPVKGTAAAKSRLEGAAGLAQAIALDTIAVVVVASRVCRVIVVTSADAAPFEQLGAEVVTDPGAGLNAAVRVGIANALGPVAALLGDLPALRPDELDVALSLADAHELSFVADADAEGSTLIAALRPDLHDPAFGAGSRAAHRAAGYVELPVAASSGLRRDVDTADQLAALAGRLGPRTAALA
jgi:2-phospho-L-lactate guanylyltransferase